MSTRQLDFQLEVTRKCIHQSALVVMQTFSEVFHDPQKLHRPDVIERVKDIRGDERVQHKFAMSMSQRAPGVENIYTRAMEVSTRLFHHAEVLHGAKIGRYRMDAISFWRKVFDEMVRTVFIHPMLYAVQGYELSASLKIISEMFDQLLYSDIPLHIEDTFPAESVPLTEASLRHPGRVTLRDGNVRKAPSAVSSSSSQAPPPPHPHHVPAGGGVLRGGASYPSASLVSTPSSMDDSEKRKILSEIYHREQIGDTLSSEVGADVLRVQVQSEERKKP